MLTKPVPLWIFLVSIVIATVNGYMAGRTTAFAEMSEKISDLKENHFAAEVARAERDRPSTCDGTLFYDRGWHCDHGNISGTTRRFVVGENAFHLGDALLTYDDHGFCINIMGAR